MPRAVTSAARAARRGWRAAPGRHDAVEHAALEKRFRPLEAWRRLLAERLLDHARAREADQRARLGEVDVAEETYGGRDATRRRVRQHGDARHAGLPEAGQRRRHLGHLHEREDALLEAGPARGGAHDERHADRPGVLDEARETLADPRPHAAAEEGEVEDRERHPMPAEACRAGEDPLPAPGLPARRPEPGPVARERERIGSSETAVSLHERSPVDQQPHARRRREPQVMATARAHLESPCPIPAVRGLGTGRTAPGCVGQLPTHGRAAACIAACREATKVATLPGAPRRSPSSRSRPIALPTITASAKPASQPACSGVLTPKPTPTGSGVTRRTRAISSGRSSGSAARAPVVPSTETK